MGGNGDEREPEPSKTPTPGEVMLGLVGGVFFGLFVAWVVLCVPAYSFTLVGIMNLCVLGPVLGAVFGVGLVFLVARFIKD